jgi:cell division topological specificity factor
MMAFMDYFRRAPKTTASLAKDRLSIIVARERSAVRTGRDYLPQLQQELLQVLAKYEQIDLDQVSVNVDKQDGCDVLELNVVLAAAALRPASPRA